ncbi:hypothetical protein HKX48_004411 [Thoreauomyces humboldtii]|nr:hypothetical protein HKX48_004411 [Thoreauomyces humboldtii]
MGHKRSELEHSASKAVNVLLAQWGKQCLPRPATSPEVPVVDPALIKLPPVEWKHFAQKQGVKESERTVQYLTVWSQPTSTDPVPRATASVWVTYMQQAAASGKDSRPATAPESLVYRFEHQHLVHSIPYKKGGRIVNRPLANPTIRLPEIIASKHQVSDAIVNRKLLQSKNWTEWHAHHANPSSKSINGSNPGLDSAGLSVPRSDGLVPATFSPDAAAETSPSSTDVSAIDPFTEAPLSPWTHAALHARQERAQTAVTEREKERSPADHDHPAPVIPQPASFRCDAETVMGRTYLRPSDTATCPPLPEDWNIESRTADMELLRAEREARAANRAERAEYRMVLEQERAYAALHPAEEAAEEDEAAPEEESETAQEEEERAEGATEVETSSPEQPPVGMETVAEASVSDEESQEADSAAADAVPADTFADILPDAPGAHPAETVPADDQVVELLHEELASEAEPNIPQEATSSAEAADFGADDDANSDEGFVIHRGSDDAEDEEEVVVNESDEEDFVLQRGDEEEKESHDEGHGLGTSDQGAADV